MIAAKARLPKANVHYYFGTKERLYRAVLQRILEAWLASGDGIRADAEPAAAFADYIAAKIEASRRQPYASKVFANEILHGAPQLADYLRGQVRRWVEDKAKVIDRWVAAGQMQPVDVPSPLLRHLVLDPDLCRFRVPDAGRAEARAPEAGGLCRGHRAHHPHGAGRLRELRDQVAQRSISRRRSTSAIPSSGSPIDQRFRIASDMTV